jgi:hypothetical protein
LLSVLRYIEKRREDEKKNCADTINNNTTRLEHKAAKMQISYKEYMSLAILSKQLLPLISEPLPISFFLFIYIFVNYSY